ncbi:M20/M25/M40 family metallo-hydrolase [Gemmatimonadota bacterium]
MSAELIEDLRYFLRINTSEYCPEGKQEAHSWLRQKYLDAGGLITWEKDVPDGGMIVLFGSYDGAVIIYSHYDVFPPNTAAWTVDPYSAGIVGNRIYGVGARDTKANLLGFLNAIERLRFAEKPIPNIVFILDGGEEIESPYLQEMVTFLDSVNSNWQGCICADGGGDDT